MKHYCIYEWNYRTKKTRFIEEYNSIEDAEDMANSLNNFKEEKIIFYTVRCLEDEEIKDKLNYNIWINKLLITTV